MTEKRKRRRFTAEFKAHTVERLLPWEGRAARGRRQDLNPDSPDAVASSWRSALILLVRPET
jgi:hypothetical protein